MRTLEEIQQEIEREADKYTELETIQKNRSEVAWWIILKRIFAALTFSIENIIALKKKEIDNKIAKTESGTTAWLAQKVMEYQHGDALQIINNTLRYPKIDTVKQIVKKVAIREKTTGGCIVKVAKENASQLHPLTISEKLGLRIYLNNIIFAGIPVTVESNAADIFFITKAIVQINADIFDTTDLRNPMSIQTGTNTIIAAIKNYISDFGFDDAFYLSNLEMYLRKVDGVSDVKIDTCSIGGVIIDRKLDQVPAGYMTLNENQNNITYVTD